MVETRSQRETRKEKVGGGGNEVPRVAGKWKKGNRTRGVLRRRKGEGEGRRLLDR